MRLATCFNFGSKGCSPSNPHRLLISGTGMLRTVRGCSDQDKDSLDFSMSQRAPPNSTSFLHTPPHCSRLLRIALECSVFCSLFSCFAPVESRLLLFSPPLSFSLLRGLCRCYNSLCRGCAACAATSSSHEEAAAISAGSARPSQRLKHPAQRSQHATWRMHSLSRSCESPQRGFNIPRAGHSSPLRD